MRTTTTSALFDPKYDRCPPFEANCAQTGVDVVTPSTSLRKAFQGLTRSLDTVDVAKGNVVTRASSNIFIELKQISLRTWAKADLKRSHGGGWISRV